MTITDIHEYNELIEYIECDPILIAHQLNYEEKLTEGYKQLNEIKNKAMMNDLKYPKLEEGFFEGIEDSNSILDKINSLANILLDSILEQYNDSEFEEMLSKYETLLTMAEEGDKINRVIQILTIYKDLK